MTFQVRGVAGAVTERPLEAGSGKLSPTEL